MSFALRDENLFETAATRTTSRRRFQVSLRQALRRPLGYIEVENAERFSEQRGKYRRERESERRQVVGRGPQCGTRAGVPAVGPHD